MRIRDQEQLRQLIRLRAGKRVPADMLRLLADTGAILKGHFRLQSGMHSPYFARVGQLLYRPDDANQVATLMSHQLEPLRGQQNLVCLTSDNSSAYLARAVARHLNAPIAISKVDRARRPIAELAQGELSPNDKVLIVTDVVATGGSIEPLLELIRAHGAKPLRVSALLVLSSPHFTQLLEKHDLSGDAYLEAGWQPQESEKCTQCAAGEPLLAGFEFN